MPPRVAGTQRSRQTPQPPDGFQQLNLPPLRGTPSSRRQYAYGASAEPLPARPTRGAQRGSTIDLNQAVQDVLSKQSRTQQQQREALARSRTYEATTSNPGTEADDQDADELAMDEQTFRNTSAGGNPHMNMVGNANLYALNVGDASDLDDIRSFDVESDFYGEATIASTPASYSNTKAPQNPTLSRSLADSAASQTPRTRTGPVQVGLPPDSPSVEPEDSVADTRDLAGRHREANPAQRPSPARPTRGFLADLERNNQQIREPQVAEPDIRRQGFEDEENTPAPKRPMERRARRPPSTQANHRTAALRPEAPTPSQRRRRKSTDERPNFPEANEEGSLRRLEVGRRPPQPANGAESLLARLTPRRLWRPQAPVNGNMQPSPPIANNDVQRESLFSRAKTLALAASPLHCPQARYQPSNESEQDYEMQRQIERDDRQAEKEVRRQERAEHRRQRTEALKIAWQGNWEWLKSHPPITWFLGQQEINALGNEYLLEERPRWSWLRWLNPWTYLVLVITAVGKLIAQLFETAFITWTIVRRQLESRQLTLLSLGALAAVLFLLPTLSRMETSLPSIPQISVRDDISWSAISETAGYIRDRLPSLPSIPALPLLQIPWPSRPSSIFDYLDVDEDELLQLGDFTKMINQEFAQLEKATKLHGTAIKKLEALLPKVIHMPAKGGKVSIPDEFWHAVRERIRKDGDIMTFDDQKGSYSVSSDKQWRSIMTRLLKDPAFEDKLDSNAAETESRTRRDTFDALDTWLKNNKQAIMDQELEKGKARGSDDKSAVISKHHNKDQQDGIFMSRDEFLRLVNKEVTRSKNEIKAELDGLRPQLNSVKTSIREAVNLALQDTPKAVTSAEVTRLVTTLVRDSIARLDLEAVAKGKINVHWDAQLKHRVNYFSIATGAIINKKYTSPEWNPKNDDAIGKAKSLPKTLRDRLGPNPPSRVFHPWFEDGDRWCAARTLNRRGNPHGSMLGITMGFRIVPTHFVLEHMLAGATIDPDARPRGVELYASIEDAEQRKYIEEFAAKQYADNGRDWDYQPPEEFDPSYVKIGEFQYEGADSHDGRYVYRLSSELENAATDSIIVRAVSNYGSKDHTCFYRVRMYGERVDE